MFPQPGTDGKQHNIEFTMLEWYSPGAAYGDIEQQTREFIRSICPAAGITPPAFTRITMEEAFQEFAGIELAPLCSDSAGDGLRQEALKRNIRTSSSDSWNDLFQRLFISLVEPELPGIRLFSSTTSPPGLPAWQKKRPEPPGGNGGNSTGKVLNWPTATPK